MEALLSNPDMKKSLALRITGEILSQLLNAPLLSGALITSIQLKEKISEGSFGIPRVSRYVLEF